MTLQPRADPLHQQADDERAQDEVGDPKCFVAEERRGKREQRHSAERGSDQCVHHDGEHRVRRVALRERLLQRAADEVDQELAAQLKN